MDTVGDDGQPKGDGPHTGPATVPQADPPAEAAPYPQQPYLQPPPPPPASSPSPFSPPPPRPAPMPAQAPAAPAAPAGADAGDTGGYPAAEQTATSPGRPSVGRLTSDAAPRAAGGRLADLLDRVGRGRRERAEKRQASVEAARVPLMRPVRIVIASAKGGVGKTTVALGLGETLARLRADRVALLDAQPLGGTVGLRVAGHRGLGLPALLGEVDDVVRDGSYTAWSRYATIEHGTRITVFGRVEPVEGAELGIESYGQLVDGIARMWPIVVVDTGAPEGRSALQMAVVNSADVLVVVASPGEATVAATAGWLRDVSIPPMRRVGVVVPVTGGDDQQVEALMRSTCVRVAQVPRDPALAAEAAVPLFASARSTTSDAFVDLAGMVMAASAVGIEHRG